MPEKELGLVLWYCIFEKRGMITSRDWATNLHTEIRPESYDSILKVGDIVAFTPRVEVNPNPDEYGYPLRIAEDIVVKYRKSKS